MTTRADVQKFLNDFFAKYRVYDILFRDYRNKNSEALLSLEITPNKRREIIESLQEEDYSQGPLDDTLYGIASMWVFGKLVKGTEVYIKISLGRKPSSNPIPQEARFIVKKLYRLLKQCGDVFSCNGIIALGDRYFCSVIPHR